MRIPPTPIRFSSSIVLVNQHDFEGLRDQLFAPHEEDLRGDRQYGCADPFSLNVRAAVQPRAVVEGAADCTIGGITNGKAVTLTHLFPRSSEAQAVQRTLAYDLEQLRSNASRELRGLLTAGRAFSGRTTAQSREVFEALKTTMEDAGFGDNITRLWGRRSGSVNGYTDAIYNSGNDAWYVHVGRMDQVVSPLRNLVRKFPKPGFMQGLSNSIAVAFDPAAKRVENPVLSEEELKNTFAEVHIAPGDTLVTPRDKEYKRLVTDVLA